jgi:Protein of unknown function (DUF3341)
MADRVLAEFAGAGELAAAIRSLRERGYRRLDAYAPFAAPEVEEALAAPRSRLPLVIFAGGMLAAGGAYLLQWFLVAYLYPLNVGDRPPHFPLAFLVITFEMGILFAALTAVGGVLARGRLVRLDDEVQGVPGFVSASRDAFWLEVIMDDPRFDRDSTRTELAELGALRVELAPVEEATP